MDISSHRISMKRKFYRQMEWGKKTKYEVRKLCFSVDHLTNIVEKLASFHSKKSGDMPFVTECIQELEDTGNPLHLFALSFLALRINKGVLIACGTKFEWMKYNFNS